MYPILTFLRKIIKSYLHQKGMFYVIIVNYQSYYSKMCKDICHLHI